MTPVARFLKKTAERYLGTFNEGPEPPIRLAQHVAQFAKAHPKATVAEWAEFASQHAANSYRAGYERGYAWSAREDMTTGRVAESERIAEELAHAWELPDVPTSVDDPRVVPEQRDRQAEAADEIDAHNEGSLEWEQDRRALGPSR